MLGFPILHCKGMRPMMFQLSSFCYRVNGSEFEVGFRDLGVCISD